MSVNFGLMRIGMVICCIAGFIVFGGFDVHWISNQGEARIYLASIAAFLIGSVCVSMIDHETGHMEPRTNLRGAYVLGGILMMAGAIWFLVGCRS